MTTLWQQSRVKGFERPLEGRTVDQAIVDEAEEGGSFCTPIRSADPSLNFEVQMIVFGGMEVDQLPRDRCAVKKPDGVDGLCCG